MSESNLHALVAEIIGLVLQVPPPHEDLRRALEPRWDSLKHVEIIFALEDACGITFTEEDMTTMDSVSSIATLIARYKAEP